MRARREPGEPLALLGPADRRRGGAGHRIHAAHAGCEARRRGAGVPAPPMRSTSGLGGRPRSDGAAPRRQRWGDEHRLGPGGAAGRPGLAHLQRADAAALCGFGREGGGELAAAASWRGCGGARRVREDAAHALRGGGAARLGGGDAGGGGECASAARGAGCARPVLAPTPTSGDRAARRGSGWCRGRAGRRRGWHGGGRGVAEELARSDRKREAAQSGAAAAAHGVRRVRAGAVFRRE
mmetsp:Transcript_42094/g.135351  ORF Transcript_42094/g.135351 Transcript_42094/m.135351 type:complete len:239 (+) Transcript_42094:926-1642(+)